MQVHYNACYINVLVTPRYNVDLVDDRECNKTWRDKRYNKDTNWILLITMLFMKFHRQRSDSLRACSMYRPPYATNP